MTETSTSSTPERSQVIHPRFLRMVDPQFSHLDPATLMLTEPTINRAFVNHINSDKLASGDTFLQFLLTGINPLLYRTEMKHSTTAPSQQQLATEHSMSLQTTRSPIIPALGNGTDNIQRETLATPLGHGVIWTLKHRQLPNKSLKERVRDIWGRIGFSKNTYVGIQALQTKLDHDEKTG